MGPRRAIARRVCFGFPGALGLTEPFRLDGREPLGVGLIKRLSSMGPRALAMGSRLPRPFGNDLALAAAGADRGPSPATPGVCATIVATRLDRGLDHRRLGFG